MVGAQRQKNDCKESDGISASALMLVQHVVDFEGIRSLDESRQFLLDG